MIFSEDPIIASFLLLLILTGSVLAFQALRGLLNAGVTAGRVFVIVWVVVYLMPVLVFLTLPHLLVRDPFYFLMQPIDWVVSLLTAYAGLGAFFLGYTFISRQISKRAISFDKPVSVRPQPIFAWGVIIFSIVNFILLIIGFIHKGLVLDFDIRQTYWREINHFVFYLSFPAFLSALYINKFCRVGFIGRLVLLITVLFCFAMAIMAGQRMLIVMHLMIAGLFYLLNNPLARKKILIGCVVLTLLFSGVYRFYFRGESKGDILDSVMGTFVGDLSRVQILSYIQKNMNIANSELLDVPIVPSYLYWFILPIPRAIWTEKPYVALLQFNSHAGYSFKIDYLDKNPDELFCGYEFGFIDEALMNLGFLGFAILALLGAVAARIDFSRRRRFFSRLAFILFIFMGMAYSFHSTVALLTPLMFVASFFKTNEES